MSKPVFFIEPDYLERVAEMLSLGGTIVVCGDLLDLKERFIPELLSAVDNFHPEYNLRFHETARDNANENLSLAPEGKLLCISGHPDIALRRYAKKLNIQLDEFLARIDYALYVEGDTVHFCDLVGAYSTVPCPSKQVKAYLFTHKNRALINLFNQ